jgi:hypothetical protein
MQYKTTRKLFKNKYQYKIVLTVKGAQLFRTGDMDTALDGLKQVTLAPQSISSNWRNTYIKTQEDLDYAFKLQAAVAKMTDHEIRVESPWLTVYTNSKKDIKTLTDLDENNVKYISSPPTNSSLSQDTIIMPKMNYEYRVTLGKTTQEHSTFISWAENNAKLKLTKSCIRDLEKVRSWGGKYFYITGDNNLLMAKMHLGGSIAKIERIVKE